MNVAVDLDSPGGPVLRLHGEIDMLVAEEVREAGEQAVPPAAQNGRRLVIDMAEVSFLDSTGIGALVAIANTARDSDVTVVLRSASERIERLLSITGLEGVFATEA